MFYKDIVYVYAIENKVRWLIKTLNQLPFIQVYE